MKECEAPVSNNRTIGTFSRVPIPARFPRLLLCWFLPNAYALACVGRLGRCGCGARCGLSWVFAYRARRCWWVSRCSPSLWSTSTVSGDVAILPTSVTNHLSSRADSIMGPVTFGTKIGPCLSHSRWIKGRLPCKVLWAGWSMPWLLLSPLTDFLPISSCLLGSGTRSVVAYSWDWVRVFLGPVSKLQNMVVRHN